jgi:hypothetical protein
MSTKFLIALLGCLFLSAWVAARPSPTDPIPGKKCESVSAEAQCNLGMACTTVGADCQRCTTNPSLRVRRCVTSSSGYCSTGTGPGVACGERIVGTCISDGFGGSVCAGFAAGDCGEITPNCSL